MVISLPLMGICLLVLHEGLTFKILGYLEWLLCPVLVGQPDLLHSSLVWLQMVLGGLEAIAVQAVRSEEGVGNIKTMPVLDLMIVDQEIHVLVATLADSAHHLAPVVEAWQLVVDGVMGQPAVLPLVPEKLFKAEVSSLMRILMLSLGVDQVSSIIEC
jgi:hypothetical protein